MTAPDDTVVIPEQKDALGAALRDAHAGGTGTHTVERDDGVGDIMDAAVYFSRPEAWPPVETIVLDHVRGRVLDLGAGAGRLSLALQERGDEPVALDISPGAIEVCAARGVPRTFLGSVHRLAASEPETFDAVAMLGHNLSLLASPGRAGPMLEALRTVLAPGGVVVGTCLHPYLTDDPVNLAYHQRNRDQGRMAGQLRLRVSCGAVTGDWFDWLLLSPAELASIAGEAGWQVVILHEPDPTYVAELRPM